MVGAERLCMPQSQVEGLDLSVLYEQHAQRLRAVIARLGGPYVDVEDLLHDVFVIALRKQAGFEGRSTAGTWLYGIALKVVAAARRKARLRRFFRLDDVEGRAAELATTSVFERQEASATVYRILERLAEKKRAVFVLFELEGLSGEEIARAVGCPLKTVWTRLHHARREFHQHLEQERRSVSHE
jgi:RNA polymerase sigma-70 factor (ECF subfamily)